MPARCLARRPARRPVRLTGGSLLFVALVLTFGLAACGGTGGGGGGATTASASPDELRAQRKESDPRVFHRSLGEPEFLDPGTLTESEGAAVTSDTFEGLFVYGPTHTETNPGVAKRMETSEDGTTVTFHLRSDARWSDGEPVTAQDFAWSWKRVLNPETGSQYASIMWVIDGAKAYSQGKGPRSGVGVTAVDDTTLKVQLVAPTPYFKQLTCFHTFSPVPRQTVEEYGDQWARPQHMVSNGPWTVNEWESMQRITAVKNKYYWNKGAMPFDKIVYHIAQEQQPHYNMYQAGKLDALFGRVPSSAFQRLRRRQSQDLRISPYLSVYYYVFNTEQEPVDDPKVRKALNLAIDKSKIGSYVLKGGQKPGRGPVYRGLQDMGYQPVKGQPYNPQKAKKLLAEAGYPGGQGMPLLEISYNTLESHKQIAEYIQQQWKKNLGIEADLKNMEWKVLLKSMDQGDFQIARYGWIGDYVDPMTYLNLWTTNNANNDTRWSNATYDRLIQQARTTADSDKRMKLLHQAEKTFMSELPAIPVYYYVQQDLVKPWLKGYQPHLLGIHLARYFHIDYGGEQSGEGEQLASGASEEAASK